MNKCSRLQSTALETIFRIGWPGCPIAQQEGYPAEITPALKLASDEITTPLKTTGGIFGSKGMKSS